MIICAYKNTLINTFCNPVFDDHDIETIVKNAKRGLTLAYHDDAKKIANQFGYCDFYKLGEFDEETGEIKSDVCLLFSVKELLGLPSLDIMDEAKDGD